MNLHDGQLFFQSKQMKSDFFVDDNSNENFAANFFLSLLKLSTIALKDIHYLEKSIVYWSTKYIDNIVWFIKLLFSKFVGCL